MSPSLWWPGFRSLFITCIYRGLCLRAREGYGKEREHGIKTFVMCLFHARADFCSLHSISVCFLPRGENNDSGTEAHVITYLVWCTYSVYWSFSYRLLREVNAARARRVEEDHPREGDVGIGFFVGRGHLQAAGCFIQKLNQ